MGSRSSSADGERGDGGLGGRAAGDNSAEEGEAVGEGGREVPPVLCDAGNDAVLKRGNGIGGAASESLPISTSLSISLSLLSGKVWQLLAKPSKLWLILSLSLRC